MMWFRLLVLFAAWSSTAFTCGDWFARSGVASAALVNVLVISPLSETHGGFTSSGRYGQAFDDLMNPTFFGPSGTVPYSFNFTGSTTVPTDFTGIDLVIFSHVGSPAASSTWSPDPAQIGRVTNFVQEGGRLLALGNSIGQNWDALSQTGARSFSEAFGGPAANFTNQDGGTVATSNNPQGANMTVASSSTGPANGPFGDISLLTTSSTVNATWSGVDPNDPRFSLQYTFGSPLNSNGRDGYFGEFGDGRFLLVGSFNMFGASAIGGTDSRYGIANNDLYLRNSVAWLTEGVVAVPEPSAWFAMAITSGLLALRRRGAGFQPAKAD